MNPDNSSRLLKLLPRLPASVDDKSFLIDNLIPALNLVRDFGLEEAIIEAIFQTSSKTFTIPWIYALLDMADSSKLLDWKFVKLFSQFMDSFRVDHARLIGGLFVNLINKIDSKAEKGVVDFSMKICITSALRRGVSQINGKIDNAPTSISTPMLLTLSPVHTSLAYWSVLSNRYLLADEMLYPNITYTKPDIDFPNSQLSIVQFHYYSSLILISQKRYSQAIEYLNVVLSIPPITLKHIIKIHSNLRQEAYKKWVCVSILRLGTLPKMSKLVKDEEKQRLKKKCELYYNLRDLFEESDEISYSSVSSSIDKINKYLKSHTKEFKKDGNLDLILLCLENYKQNYIKKLQANVFSSMKVANLARAFSSSTSAPKFPQIDSYIYDYINDLILTGQVSPDDYKIVDGETPYLISQLTPSINSISQINKNLGQLIQSVVLSNEILDSTSRDIIVTGQYARLLQLTLNTRKHHNAQSLNDINDEMYGITGVNIPGYDHATFARRRGGIPISSPHEYGGVGPLSGGRRRSAGGTSKRITQSNRRRGNLTPRVRQPSQRSRAELTGSGSDMSSEDDFYEDMDRDSDNYDSTEN